MTRFLDSLAATITGMLIGVLLCAAIAPGAWEVMASRTGVPWPLLRVAIAAPSPSAETSASFGAPTGKRPAPTATPRTASPLRGVATWFNSPAGVSAAGPDLRAALGPGWRGTHVQVCHDERCVVTILGDTMAADRLIDLDAPLFARLAPLSAGLLAVTLTVIPAPPVTTRETP
jgi:hypothetical protein